MYTKGEWKAVKNAVGTYTIQTEDARIGEIDRHFNARLIAAAVSACVSVNPDNPLAVAGSIGEMVEALKKWMEYLDTPYPKNMITKKHAYNLTEQALAKAEGK